MATVRAELCRTVAQRPGEIPRGTLRAIERGSAALRAERGRLLEKERDLAARTEETARDL